MIECVNDVLSRSLSIYLHILIFFSLLSLSIDVLKLVETTVLISMVRIDSLIPIFLRCSSLFIKIVIELSSRDAQRRTTDFRRVVC